jgi:hypothetical protein
MGTCFLIGHRDAADWLLSPLSAAVERHITEMGVTEFVVGHYGAFDRLAARAIRQAKQKYPDVRLTLLLPYYGRAGEGQYDDSFFPPGLETVPKRCAIPRANRYMIDHSDYLISYAWQPGSNTNKLTEYARRREKRGLICVTELALPQERDRAAPA